MLIGSASNAGLSRQFTNKSSTVAQLNGLLDKQRQKDEHYY